VVLLRDGGGLAECPSRGRLVKRNKIMDNATPASSPFVALTSDIVGA
jgi:hypothetical protein